MAPQLFFSAFTPEVRKEFEDQLNKRSESRKLLMNATKRAEYLRYLADPDAKIIEKNKIEKKRLNSVKNKAIQELCVDAWQKLLNVEQKKEPITKPQAFFYNAFSHIERINAIGGHNGYKKTFQRVKREVYGISRDDVQWLLEHCQV